MIDANTAKEALFYLGSGYALYAACKYIGRPWLLPEPSAREKKAIKTTYAKFQSDYGSAMSQRLKVTEAMLDQGKGPEDITRLLDESMPIPKEPNI